MPNPADTPGGAGNGTQPTEAEEPDSPLSPDSPQSPDPNFRPKRSVEIDVRKPATDADPEPPKREQSNTTATPSSTVERADDRKSTASQRSNKSRKSNFLKRAGTLQKVATFANNLGMDEDELRSEDGNERRRVSDNDENETGTERLQRALTTETKHKGLFRYTNTLGQTDGMEPDMLMRVALEDEWQMVSCASLPFTIIFFVIFMLFFQQHYGITDIFLAEYPFRRVLGEEAWEIEKVDGIYEWLEGSYFPYMWASLPRTPVEDMFQTSNMYSTLIGGVKLTTTRSKEGPCEDELVSHIKCFTAEADADSGNAFFGRRLLRENSAEFDRPVQDIRREKTVGPLDTSGLQQERGKVPKSRRNSGPKRRLSVNLAQPAWGEKTMFERWATFVRGEAEERRLEHRERGQRQQRWKAKLRNRGDRIAFEEIDQIKRPRHETFWSSVERRLKRFRPDLEGETPKMGVGNLSSIVVSAVDSLQDVKDQVQVWSDLRLFRESTRTFQAEALMENNNLGHDLLTVVQFDFTIHGSGSMFSETFVVTLIGTAVADDMLQATLGIIWFCCLSIFSYMLPNRAYMRWRQGRLRSHFMRFWNLVEWMIIMWGWMVVLVFCYERHLIWNLKDSIDEYKKEILSLHPATINKINQQRVPDLLDEAQKVASLSAWVQLLVSLFHIILVFRFFLASRGQPRLAIVLSTIRKAAVDLFHLFLVFIIIFVAYAVSGHMLFGRRLSEFSTFQAAFAQCFKIVMEREYPWIEFTAEDQWTSTIWVWSFMLLVVLVLVNIFLAMIFDTYGDVRSSVGHSATLWQTTKIVFAHLKHLVSFGDESQNRWVPNRELVHSVKAMQCHHVTPWMVKDAFPGIDNKQVNYLFNLAKNRLENMLVRGNKTSLPAVVASILLAVERMHNELHAITGIWSDDGIRGTMVSVVERKTETEPAMPVKSDDTMPEKPDKNENGNGNGENGNGKNGNGEETSDKLKNEEKLRDSEGNFADLKVGFDVEEAKEPEEIPDIPAQAPHWLTVQLMPHFKKQKMLLTEVHVQIQRIDRAMYLRGIKGLPKNPEATPRQLKTQGALGSPGRGLLPYGPSNATSFGGITPPAALRQSVNYHHDGNGAKYDLISSFALPDQPLASPGSARRLSRNEDLLSTRVDRANCCSCKPLQPLHD